MKPIVLGRAGNYQCLIHRDVVSQIVFSTPIQQHYTTSTDIAHILHAITLLTYLKLFVSTTTDNFNHLTSAKIEEFQSRLKLRLKLKCRLETLVFNGPHVK